MSEMSRLYQRGAGCQAESCLTVCSAPSFSLAALLAFLVMFFGGSILAPPQPRRSAKTKIYAPQPIYANLETSGRFIDGAIRFDGLLTKLL
jgi:hypothetical protein